MCFRPWSGDYRRRGRSLATATNVRSGAKTPVSGMIHALTLLGIIAVFAPLARRVPFVCAGGHPDGGVLQHG